MDVSVASNLAGAMNNLLVQAKCYIALPLAWQPMSGQQLGCWTAVVMWCAYTVCAGAVWHSWHHQGVLHPLRQEVRDLLQRAAARAHINFHQQYRIMRE